ncbi:unnamed protein product, partial [Scytosiphon promiscuus]
MDPLVSASQCRRGKDVRFRTVCECRDLERRVCRRGVSCPLCCAFGRIAVGCRSESNRQQSSGRLSSSGVCQFSRFRSEGVFGQGLCRLRREVLAEDEAADTESLQHHASIRTAFE